MLKTTARVNAYHELDKEYRRKNVWWHDRGQMLLLLSVAFVYLSRTGNGYDSALIPAFQVLGPWKKDFGHPDASKIGLLNMASYVSGLVSAPLAAYASDRFGRRWMVRYVGFCIFFSSLLAVFAGVGSTSAYNMFLGERIVIGSAFVVATMIFPIVMQELPHPSHRDSLAAYVDTCQPLGAIISAWITFGTAYLPTSWAWRAPCLVQVPPALIVLIGSWYVPETPRWLLSKGRQEEARAFLVKYHGNGNPEDPVVVFEYNEMLETLEREAQMEPGNWSVMWATRANRRRIALVMLLAMAQYWSGEQIITFYYKAILKIVGISGTHKITGINGGLKIWAWIASMFGAWLVPRVPRRTLLISCWFGLLCCNIGLTVSSARYAETGSEAAGVAAVVFVWIFEGFYSAVSSTLLFVYVAEVLPLNLRSKGMCMNSCVERVLGIFNAYVNSIALDRIGWYYYLVYTGAIVFQITGFYFLAKNTGGRTLEEIAELFEGKSSTTFDRDVEAESSTTSASTAEEKPIEKPVVV